MQLAERVTIRAWIAQMLRTPGMLAWFLLVFTLPFYVSDSGRPQPSNALLILILPAALIGWNGRLGPRQKYMVAALLLFVGWVWIVNYAWLLIRGGKLEFAGFAMAPLYYTFNSLIMLSALVLAHRRGRLFVRTTLYAALLVTVLMVVASPTMLRGGYRAELFFNNPNQLGYWALLVATFVAISHRRLALPLVWTVGGLLACSYLAVVSGSRASVGGIAILVMLLVFSNPRVIVTAMIASIGLLALGGGPSSALDSTGVQMLQRGDRGGTFAEERNYTRIWEFKEYTILGAGEGDYQRFVPEGHVANEIHSSLGTVFFCYGIVGAFLFLRLIFGVFRGVPLSTTTLLFPVFSFAIAHQGLRFSLFWIVLAVFATLAPTRRVAKAAVTVP